MAVVGSAEVIVRAITNKVKADIQKAFSDARPAVQAEGRKAGKDFAGAFDQSVRQSLSPKLKSAFASAAADAADEAGKVLKRDLPGEVKEAADEAGNAAEASLGNAGRRGGNAFGAGFLNSGFANSAVAASSAFTTLFAVTNILGPAIAGLVGMLSAAASGLFAMGAAASQAAGAIAVLPGLLAVVGQMFAAVKLGFGGVGAAVSAGAKAQDAAAAAATNAGKAAAEAGKATTKGAGAQIAAAKALATATERVKQAQDDASRTQDRLNKLQGIASDGAEEAALASRLLAGAQQKANEVLADPNASAEQGAAAQKALSDAEQADKAVAQSREQAQKRMQNAAEKNDAAQRRLAAAEAARNKLQKDQDKAAAGIKAGGINTPAIKAANAYQQALEQLSPAAQAFVEKLLDMRERVKDLRDAIAGEMLPPLTEALGLLDKDAIWNILEENLKESGRLFGEAGLSLAKLIDTDTARSGIDKWMKANNEILTVFTGKTADAHSPLDALAQLVGKLALAIQPVTLRFSKWIGALIIAKEETAKVGGATSGLTGFFNRAGDVAAKLGKIIGNIVSAVGNLGSAATPAGNSLLESFRKATHQFDKFTERIGKDGSAGKYFNGVARNLRQIGKLVNTITVEFVGLGDNKGVGKLAKGLIPAVENIGSIADKLSSGEVGESLGKLATQVTEFMDKLTSSDQIKIFIDTLTDIVGAVNKVIEKLAEIPGVAKFTGYVLAFAAMSRAFSFAAKIASFFGKAIIGGPIAALKLLFGLNKKKIIPPVVPPPAAGAAGASAAAAGRAPLVGVGPGRAGGPSVIPPAATQRTSKLGKALGGVGKVAGKAGGAFKLLGRGLGALLGGPIFLLITLMPLIIKGFKLLYSKSPQFRAFIGFIVKGFKDIVTWAKPILTTVGKFLVKVFDDIMKKVREVMPTIRKIIGDVFSAIGGFVKKYIIPAWNNVLLPAIKLLGRVVKTVIPIVGKLIKFHFKVVIGAVKLVIGVFKIAFKIIKFLLVVVVKVFKGIAFIIGKVFGFVKAIWNNVLKPVINAIKKAFSVAGNVVKKVFESIKQTFDNFKKGLTRVKDFVITVVDKIKSVFGTVKDSVKNAFGGLADAVRPALNSFISFINSKLLGPLRTVGSKFGIDIPDIKTFATGGKVSGPGTATSDSIAARLSDGEFVFKTSAAKALGYKDLEYMNRTGKLPAGTTDGTGGLGSWASDLVKGGADILADGARYVAKQGLGPVLQKLTETAKGLLGSVDFGSGSFLKDMAYGFMDKLAGAVETWGGDKGKAPKITSYDTGSLSSVAGLPSVDGWSYPLSSRFGVTQYANQGHSPSWAVDIGSPTGVPVLAVASGVVKSIVDKGATSYGKYIEIAHADGTTSLYAHLNDFLIKLGERVLRGQVIGRSGHSGGVRSSTGGDGSHLHFELKPGSDTAAMMRIRGVALAKGGVARATSGGIPAIIAEAGRDERVEPLDREGMSKRDRALMKAMVASLGGGRGGGDIIINNPMPERASTSTTKALRSKAIANGWNV